MVVKKIVHLKEMVVIRNTPRTRMNIYVDIDQKRIIYLLWVIFLDARDLFLKEVQHGEALPESMLRYTNNFLGVGRIPTDIITVPVDQLVGEEQIQRRADVNKEGGR